MKSVTTEINKGWRDYDQMSFVKERGIRNPCLAEEIEEFKDKYIKRRGGGFLTKLYIF